MATEVWCNQANELLILQESVSFVIQAAAVQVSKGQQLV